MRGASYSSYVRRHDSRVERGSLFCLTSSQIRCIHEAFRRSISSPMIAHMRSTSGAETPRLGECAISKFKVVKILETLATNAIKRVHNAENKQRFDQRRGRIHMQLKCCAISAHVLQTWQASRWFVISLMHIFCSGYILETELPASIIITSCLPFILLLGRLLPCLSLPSPSKQDGFVYSLYLSQSPLFGSNRLCSVRMSCNTSIRTILPARSKQHLRCHQKLV